jgi:hypothetical protein
MRGPTSGLPLVIQALSESEHSGDDKDDSDQYSALVFKADALSSEEEREPSSSQCLEGFDLTIAEEDMPESRGDYAEAYDLLSKSQSDAISLSGLSMIRVPGDLVSVEGISCEVSDAGGTRNVHIQSGSFVTFQRSKPK